MRLIDLESYILLTLQLFQLKAHYPNKPPTMATSHLVPFVHQSLKRAEQGLVRAHRDQHVIQGAHLVPHHSPKEFCQDGDQRGVTLCSDDKVCTSNKEIYVFS